MSPSGSKPVKLVTRKCFPVCPRKRASHLRGETMVSLIKQLSTRAEEIHATDMAMGVQGGRGALKASERLLNVRIGTIPISGATAEPIKAPQVP